MGRWEESGVQMLELYDSGIQELCSSRQKIPGSVSLGPCVTLGPRILPLEVWNCESLASWDASSCLGNTDLGILESTTRSLAWFAISDLLLLILHIQGATILENSSVILL